MLQITANKDLASLPDGATVYVAGLPLVRQRPGTASGICFITIEDETGIANIVVFQKYFDKYRKQILSSKLIMVRGKLQREGEVIHVIAERCSNLNVLLQKLTTPEQTNQILTLSRADENDGDPRSPQEKKAQLQKVVQGDIFHGGRNFR